MPRSLIFCLTVSLLFTGTACKAPTNPDSATVARGGMMPVGESAPEVVFAIDQSEVKVLPERTISYEPLETFRAKIAEETAASSAGSSASADNTNAASDGEKKSDSLWGAFSSAMGKLTGKKGHNASSSKKADVAAPKDATAESPADSATPDDSDSGSDDDDDEGW